MVCKYATRYPETMGFWKADVGGVAEQLRNNVVKSREPDQGANFMLHMQLLKEVYYLLNIHPIQNSPYACYPQTDGLVKCFSKTF